MEGVRLSQHVCLMFTFVDRAVLRDGPFFVSHHNQEVPMGGNAYLLDAVPTRTEDTVTITGEVPAQTERANDRQVQNSAGGYVYQVDDFTRLRRWLILGSEKGTFYASAPVLTKENADVVLRCIKANGVKTVATIVELRDRVPKLDLPIFALALCSAHGDENTRRMAHEAITEVCKTGTHLFQFCDFVDQMRSWGQGLKKGVSQWYEGKDPSQLAYQVIKYRQREGWTHRDVLRSAHPSAPTNEHSTIYDFICERGQGDEVDTIAAFQQAQQAERPADTVRLIEEYGNKLPREALRTEHVSDPAVQTALLNAGMPIGALVRNLGNLSRTGVVAPGSEGEKAVLETLGNAEAITKSKIHPINLLTALYTYRSGRGFRGTNTWTPAANVIDALDAAFYLAFKNVEPTGKRRLIAIDNSGSMSWPSSQIQGVPNFFARDAAAALALISVATGDPVTVCAFSAGRLSSNIGAGLQPIPLTARQRLDDAVEAIRRAPGGGTDCSLPMQWASLRGDTFDSFEIYTDNDTWAGKIHPDQALRDYRAQRGVNSKLVVFAMTPTQFTIADPNDPGMLDVVGFDSAAPAIVSDFIADRL